MAAVKGLADPESKSSVSCFLSREPGPGRGVRRVWGHFIDVQTWDWVRGQPPAWPYGHTTSSLSPGAGLSGVQPSEKWLCHPSPPGHP